MRKDLTALGIALFALLAVSVTVPAAALGLEGSLTTPGYSVTLDIAQTGSEESNALVLGESVLMCPESTYTGHKASTTPTEPVGTGDTSITISPTYKNCVMLNGESEFPSTVQMNGCDFVYSIGETVEQAVYEIAVDLVCPEGKSLMVEAFLGGSHGFRVCTEVLLPQQNLSGLQVSNVKATPSDLGIAGTVGGIHAEQSGFCGAATFEGGELAASLTASGTDAEGGSTAVAVSDEPVKGNGKLTTDGESVTLDMAAESAVLTAFGGKVSCAESTYTGHKVAVTPHELVTGGAGAATVIPWYAGCIADSGESEFPTTITMNGCDYVLEVGETLSANAYATQTQIVCPGESEIYIEMFLGGSHGFEVCQWKIPAQEGLQGAIISNKAGAPDSLEVAGPVKNISMSQSGLCGAGETSEAQFDLVFVAEGTNSAGESTGVTVTDE